MIWKDKPELGLKEDASPEVPAAHENPAAVPAEAKPRPAPGKPYRVVPVRSSPVPKV